MERSWGTKEEPGGTPHLPRVSNSLVSFQSPSKFTGLPGNWFEFLSKVALPYSIHFNSWRSRTYHREFPRATPGGGPKHQEPRPQGHFARNVGKQRAALHFQQRRRGPNDEGEKQMEVVDHVAGAEEKPHDACHCSAGLENAARSGQQQAALGALEEQEAPERSDAALMVALKGRFLKKSEKFKENCLEKFKQITSSQSMLMSLPWTNFGWNQMFILIILFCSLWFGKWETSDFCPYSAIEFEQFCTFRFQVNLTSPLPKCPHWWVTPYLRYDQKAFKHGLHVSQTKYALFLSNDAWANVSSKKGLNLQFPKKLWHTHQIFNEYGSKVNPANILIKHLIWKSYSLQFINYLLLILYAIYKD